MSLGGAKGRGTLVSFFFLDLQFLKLSGLSLSEHPVYPCFPFEASLIVSYQCPSRYLLYSYSFFSPDSSTSQYPCLHPGSSFFGAHANDLIPHAKRRQVLTPDSRYRTYEWRIRGDGLMQNSRLRIHPNRQHVETRLLSDQWSKKHSLKETSISGNQVVAALPPATAHVTPIQLRPQHPWLPFTESPCWPYSEHYTLLQRSLTLRSRRYFKPVRACHILIFLGILTILGSLIPALWRSVCTCISYQPPFFWQQFRPFAIIRTRELL